jgi:hypothetical protein
MAMADTNYHAVGEQGSQKLSTAAVEIRLGFVKKVYGILTAQLLVTTAVAFPLQLDTFNLSPQVLLGLLLVSMVLSVVCICLLSCTSMGRTYPSNYVILFTFTIAEAFLVGFVSAQYTAASVGLCVLATTLIFAGLTIYASCSTSDFTGMGPYLFAGLLALCLAGCVLSLSGFMGLQMPILNKAYAALAIVMFSLYIVYDTQKILGSIKGSKHEYAVDDYVFAALNLYLDIINIFLYLLQLFGDRK